MCCRSEKPELDTNDGEIGDDLERVDVLIMCDDRQAPAGSDRRDPHIIDPGSDGWTPDERVGIDRSLQAYTLHGARAWHAEHDRGRIAPGTLADLVVWSGDLYAHEHDPSGLLDQHAEVTLVGGHVVHSAGAVTDPVGHAVGDDPAASVRTVCAHVH
jgi:hypothetical protein